MIRSVKRGLYAVNFGGGQVDITSGKFVFSATEAYLIEDGRITAPVKGATLIGNGPETMQKVTMIGNDLALDDGVGICGKDGQSVPVGVGQPSLLIDGADRGRDAGVMSAVGRRSSPSDASRRRRSPAAPPCLAPAARAAPGTARGTRAAACSFARSSRRCAPAGAAAGGRRADARPAARSARRRRRRPAARRASASTRCSAAVSRRAASPSLLDRVADRVQRLVVQLAHLLGQERQLALARDVRRDALASRGCAAAVPRESAACASWVAVIATSCSPSSSTSSAARRCSLRLGPRNSPVSSSRPRIATG